MTTRKFAVISSDVNENYSFFLPMAARAWRTLGWTPLCLIVGTVEEWERNPRALFALENLSRGDIVSFVRPAPGYKVETTARLVRLLAASLPKLNESDYLLTADVDMIPLNKEYFLQQDWSMEFTLFNSDSYGDLTKGGIPGKFPMCYMGARARVWRSVMGLSGAPLDEEVVKALSGRLDTFDNDEMYFAYKIFQHPLFHGEVRKISDRLYRKGRCDLIIRTFSYERASRQFDRVAWTYYEAPGMIDCHCPRPGFKDPGILKRIYSGYFPGEAAWLERYLSDYLRSDR